MSLIQPAECRLNFLSNSPEETFNLGKRIALSLCAGSVVALEGALGSGKTCMAKGIACGLGITENITSPTFTIINEYTGEKISSLYHIDAYRLEGDKDFEEIGGDEIINSGGICIIEWSQNIKKHIPENAVVVTLNITGNESREIKITGLDII